MLKVDECVTENDIHVDDSMLQPGYGQLNEQVKESISLTAKSEGILLDPTYTGKVMAGLLAFIRKEVFGSKQRVMFLHTGGSPALFGYPEILSE